MPNVLPLFSGHFRRRYGITLAILLIGAFGAYRLAQYVIDDDIVGLAYVGLIIVGVTVVVAVLNSWRKGFYLFLGWLLFEDFARKFLGNNMIIFFAKDFLLLTVLISFFAATRRKEVQTFSPPFRVPLLILIWFGFMQIFNPGSTSIWYGLMGFKMFFFYVPLTLIGYALLTSEADLRKFFTVNLVLAVVIISLGIAQSILGASFLNPAVQAEDLRALSTLYRTSASGGVAYRPNGIFVSAGRYANFIMVAWMFVLGFGGYLLLRYKRGKVLAFIALPITAAGAFLTTSRGSFMWGIINAVATSIAIVWGAPWRQGEARRVFKSIRRVALGIGAGMVVLFYAYPDALLSRLAIYEETLLPSSPSSELAQRSWTYPVENFLGAFAYDRWPYGYGIGTASLGTQYVTRIFNVKPPGVGVESGFGTLVIEMGIVGLILWFVMSGAILISAWKVVKKLKGSPCFPVGFVIFWYSFFLLLPATFGGMAAYEDFLLNAYFWLLLGVLFRIPSIALSAQSAMDATPRGAPACQAI
jgi:hypothetical protein